MSAATACTSTSLPRTPPELVKSQVDVIYCGGDPNVRAAQQATQTIPIVAKSEDIVRAGFIRSLAKRRACVGDDTTRYHWRR
jgi:hypothetical protein